MPTCSFCSTTRKDNNLPVMFRGMLHGAYCCGECATKMVSSSMGYYYGRVAAMVKSKDELIKEVSEMTALNIEELKACNEKLKSLY